MYCAVPWRVNYFNKILWVIWTGAEFPEVPGGYFFAEQIQFTTHLGRTFTT